MPACVSMCIFRVSACVPFCVCAGVCYSVLVSVGRNWSVLVCVGLCADRSRRAESININVYIYIYIYIYSHIYISRMYRDWRAKE